MVYLVRARLLFCSFLFPLIVFGGEYSGILNTIADNVFQNTSALNYYSPEISANTSDIKNYVYNILTKLDNMSGGGGGSTGGDITVETKDYTSILNSIYSAIGTVDGTVNSGIVSLSTYLSSVQYGQINSITSILTDILNALNNGGSTAPPTTPDDPETPVTQIDYTAILESMKGVLDSIYGGQTSMHNDLNNNISNISYYLSNYMGFYMQQNNTVLNAILDKLAILDSLLDNGADSDNLKKIADTLEGLNTLLKYLPEDVKGILQATESINQTISNLALDTGVIKDKVSSIDDKMTINNTSLDNIYSLLQTIESKVGQDISVDLKNFEGLTSYQYNQGVQNIVDSTNNSATTISNSVNEVGVNLSSTMIDTGASISTSIESSGQAIIDSTGQNIEEVIDSIENRSKYNTVVYSDLPLSYESSLEIDNTKESVYSVKSDYTVSSGKLKETINRYGDVVDSSVVSESVDSSLYFDLDNSAVDAEFLEKGVELLDLDYSKGQLSSSFSPVTGGFDFWGEVSTGGGNGGISFIEKQASGLSDSFRIVQGGQVSANNVGGGGSQDLVWAVDDFEFLNWRDSENYFLDSWNDSPILTAIRDNVMPLIYSIMGILYSLYLYHKLLTSSN